MHEIDDDLDDVREEMEEEVVENEPDLPSEAVKRGPGAPKIVRTGRPGRPKKVYNMVPAEEADFTDAEEIFMTEIPIDKALSGTNSDEWFEAMADEMASIIKNDTWTLVNRTDEMEIIGSRMVLRNKFGADGKLQRRKARLVAQGFSQRPGIHFSQTFAPVARLSTVKLLISLAARYNCKVNQLDITTAYLNGELNEVIYIRPPKGIEKSLDILINNSQFEKSIRNKRRCFDRSRKAARYVVLIKPYMAYVRLEELGIRSYAKHYWKWEQFRRIATHVYF